CFGVRVQLIGPCAYGAGCGTLPGSKMSKSQLGQTTFISSRFAQVGRTKQEAGAMIQQKVIGRMTQKVRHMP
ncbi:MAG: hypothetical protein WCI40_08240, partial [Verrucomicrobiota bacterium]